jgi:hypothetical protein
MAAPGNLTAIPFYATIAALLLTEAYDKSHPPSAAEYRFNARAPSIFGASCFGR